MLGTVVDPKKNPSPASKVRVSSPGPWQLDGSLPDPLDGQNEAQTTMLSAKSFIIAEEEDTAKEEGSNSPRMVEQTAGGSNSYPELSATKQDIPEERDAIKEEIPESLSLVEKAPGYDNNQVELTATKHDIPEERDAVKEESLNSPGMFEQAAGGGYKYLEPTAMKQDIPFLGDVTKEEQAVGDSDNQLEPPATKQEISEEQPKNTTITSMLQIEAHSVSNEPVGVDIHDTEYRDIDKTHTQHISSNAIISEPVMEQEGVEKANIQDDSAEHQPGASTVSRTGSVIDQEDIEMADIADIAATIQSQNSGCHTKVEPAMERGDVELEEAKDAVPAAQQQVGDTPVQPSVNQEDLMTEFSDVFNISEQQGINHIPFEQVSDPELMDGMEPQDTPEQQAADETPVVETVTEKEDMENSGAMDTNLAPSAFPEDATPDTLLVEQITRQDNLSDSVLSRTIGTFDQEVEANETTITTTDRAEAERVIRQNDFSDAVLDSTTVIFFKELEVNETTMRAAENPTVELIAHPHNLSESVLDNTTGACDQEVKVNETTISTIERAKPSLGEKFSVVDKAGESKQEVSCKQPQPSKEDIKVKEQERHARQSASLETDGYELLTILKTKTDTGNEIEKPAAEATKAGTSIIKNGATSSTTPPKPTGPSEDLLDAYNNLFLIYYSRDPVISTTDIDIALIQVELLVEIAGMLGSLEVIRPYVSSCLLSFGRDLYRAIARDPTRWVKLSVLISSLPIFTEGVIHMVGRLLICPSSSACLEDIGWNARQVVVKKVGELETLKRAVDRALFLTSIRIDEKEIYLDKNDESTRDTWFVVQIWRDWYSRSVSEAIASKDPTEKILTKLYRTIAKGGDTYLPLEEVLELLGAVNYTHRPRSAVDIQEVADDLKILKESAQEIATRICINNSMVDVEEAGIEYFTCTKVNSADLPRLEDLESWP